MSNIIKLKSGDSGDNPASDSLVRGEVAIRHVAADHTASSSSKLYFGEAQGSGSVTLRQFGFGIAGDSGQHGIAIGENFTITGGNALTTSVSGDAVTIDHDDTSSQSSVNNSGQNFIQDITLDTYGHVTGITSATASGSSGIALTDLSVGSEGSASGDGAIAYNNSSGVFTYTPPVHDSLSGFVSNEHIDHSGVSITAGDGLTGGGTIASTRTLAVGAGTGIDVAADAISVDVSDFMTNGSNNRIVTATGTDAMNAEANLTFDGTTFTAVTNDIQLGDGSGSGNTILDFNSSGNDGTFGWYQASDYFAFSDDVLINGSKKLYLYANDKGSVSSDSGGTVTIDAANQIKLDAAGNDVIFQDSGTENVRISTDANPQIKMKAGGNTATTITSEHDGSTTYTTTIDALGDIVLDCGSGEDILIKENGGTYTPSADAHVATKKYVDDNAGGGSTSPSGSGSVSGNNAEIQFNDGGSFASDSSLVWDGTKVIIEVATDDTAALKLKCTEDTAEDGPRLDLERSAGGSSQAGDGDEIGRIRFNADKTNGSLITYAALEGGIVDNSDSTADGIMRVGIRRQGGYEADFFNIGCSSTGGNRAIFAGTTNEVDIGTSSKTFKTAYSRTYVGHDGAQNQTGTTDGMNFVTGNSIDVTVSSAGGIVFEMRALNLSDENLKDNISQYNTGLSMINQLTPKSFTIKDKVGTSIKDRTGFIAQDVEKISSDYVEESNYTEGDTKFLALSQNFNDELIAAQINAIKELSAKNDALEARIAALEAK